MTADVQSGLLHGFLGDLKSGQASNQSHVS